MKAQYFSAPYTRESVRDQYRKLARQWHPDINHAPNATAIMQAINAEYTALMDAATRDEMPGRSEGSYQHQATTNETLRQEMERAARIVDQFPFLTLEVCGFWLWMHGTQRRNTSAANDAALDALKAAGYRYSAHKCAWYFATIPCSSAGKTDMEQIRRKYGSQTYTSNAQQADEPAAQMH